MAACLISSVQTSLMINKWVNWAIEDNWPGPPNVKGPKLVKRLNYHDSSNE